MGSCSHVRKSVAEVSAPVRSNTCSSKVGHLSEFDLTGWKLLIRSRAGVSCSVTFGATEELILTGDIEPGLVKVCERETTDLLAAKFLHDSLKPTNL